MVDDKHKMRATKPKAAKVIPPWARRLEIAFLQANFVNKKGEIDKKRLADHFSVVPKTIESWITGRTSPHFSVLVETRELTGVSIDWILAAKDAPPIAKEYRRASGKK